MGFITKKISKLAMEDDDDWWNDSSSTVKEQMLKTIKVDKDFMSLTERLPKASYVYDINPS
jgi:hypothetical protein